MFRFPLVFISALCTTCGMQSLEPKTPDKQAETRVLVPTRISPAQPDQGPPQSETGSCSSQNTPIYALVDSPYTTLQLRWAPLAPSITTQAKILTNQLKVTDIPELTNNGLGVQRTAGDTWIEHRELAPHFQSTSPSNRQSIAYIWQAADPQMIDEESPIRFESFESLYRPQGHLIAQVFESHVRTVRRLNSLSNRPLDFAVLAGDLTDGSQRNELRWVLTALEGGIIDPDSGINDDPRPGPGNDHSDPFCSDGIAVPWYPAIGNHETLYNGGFGSITDELRRASIGSSVYDHPLFPTGYRDGATIHSDVVEDGTTAADPNRLVLTLNEVLQELHSASGQPRGHGLTQANIETGIAYYSVNPIPNRPVRLITLNTVNSNAPIGIGHEGYVDQIQFDWLRNELVIADERHELVIVLSHHGTNDFSFTSPISGHTLSALLLKSAGVILHLTGHGHNNEKRHFSTASARDDSSGYWELMLASTLDFPMQSRFIEIVDESNGYLSIYVTNIEHNAPEDSLAHQARVLAAAKLAFLSFVRGGVNDYWQKDLKSQNLLLRIRIPQTVKDNLGRHNWSSHIESIETLQQLSPP